MSLFIHLYGSQFPLDNRRTLQVSANPELTHSQSFIHSNVTVVGFTEATGLWIIYPWPQAWQQSQLLRPKSHKGRPRSHWTPSLPVAPPRGYGVGRGVATISIRQPPTSANHTKSTLNLSKNSNLLCEHSIQPRCLRASSHFQLVCQLEAPPTGTLEPDTSSLTYNHSSEFSLLSSTFPWRSAWLSRTFITADVS